MQKGEKPVFKRRLRVVKKTVDPEEWVKCLGGPYPPGKHGFQIW